MAYKVSKETFGRIVEESLAGLPEEFARALETTRIEVRDRPSRRTLRDADIGPDECLMGLFVGQSELSRSVEDSGVLPNVIYLFKGELEDYCQDEPELREEIRRTVLHELGHHFGLDEGDLDDVGYG